MRVVFGAVAIVNLLGMVLALLKGEFRGAVCFAAGFFVMAGWFVAMSVAAAAKRGDEGFGRDEGGKR